MPGLLQLRANIVADMTEISLYVVLFREVKLDF